MTRLPIRLRVALAVGLATGLVLAALGAVMYLRLEAGLEEQTRRSLDAQLGTLAGLPPDQLQDAVRESTGEVFAQVLTPDGRLVSTSPQVEAALNGRVDLAGAEPGTTYGEVAVRLVGDDEQEPATTATRVVNGRVLLVGQSREATEDALEALLTQLLVGGPLALLLAVGAGYVAATAALRPIERMRRRAADIGDDAAGERLPLPAVDDEIRRLGETLNAMLDRLESGLARERRFVAEAGHELRTPLALLKLELELARSGPRTEEEITQALRSAEEEVDRLARLAEDLLLLATAEEPPDRDRREVEVGAILRTVADRFAASARLAGRTVEVQGGSGLVVTADPDRLDRALGNLVDNAVKHGAGTVRLACRRLATGVEISVADEGVDGVLARDTEAPPGRGLGLSIVEALARAQGGSLTVDPGATGTRVVLTLPQGTTHS